MKVKVAETAGFCFGVKRAVDKVYELIGTEQKPIYTLGPIIHNEGVVADLEARGVHVITEADLDSPDDTLQNGTEKNDVVMDGRDIGTTILPNAEVKIYLTASADTRAKRRALEYEQKGEAFDLDQIRKDIIERDERDMNREVSPLKQAEDAVLVDSSEMGIDDVVNAILNVYKEKVQK